MEIAVPVAETEPPSTDDRSEAPGTRDGGARSRTGPGEQKDDAELQRETLVLLFASREPLTLGRLVELLERPATPRVQAVLEKLRAELDASPFPLVLRNIAGSWRLLTDPELASVVSRLESEPKPERISAAALETLAIVAYRQPVSKAEIEAIRGVQAGPVLRSLVDRGLVRITGRAELPGQPLLYGTTKDFLERFGLAALNDLPRDGELNED